MKKDYLNEIKSIELETKIAVISRFPLKTLKELQSLKQISHYKLLKGKIFHIRDIYFDSATNELRKAEFALRIRNINHQFLLTLKGKSQISNTGAVKRLEVEDIWSYPTFTKIMYLLRKQKVLSELGEIKFFHGDPINTLKNYNLFIIHDRQSLRHQRFIKKKLLDNKSHAELVIDSVAFRVKNKMIYHHEVEIELQTLTETDLLNSLTSSLLKIFPEDLQIWTYNKLETGIAIEKIFIEKKLDQYLDEKNNLLPPAYKIIKEYIDQFRF